MYKPRVAVCAEIRTKQTTQSKAKQAPCRNFEC